VASRIPVFIRSDRLPPFRKSLKVHLERIAVTVNPVAKASTAPLIRIGTAGWVVPKMHAGACAPTGTHLEKYSGVLNAVEINSTFYRPHQSKTFERWATTTPEDFRFVVKLAKSITHEAKLVRAGALLASFFDNVRPLGEKLGPVLVQLPPKLAFDLGTAREFFETVRELHSGPLVLEPRHASWFTLPVDPLLREFEVARAMADPPAGSPAAAEPGGWPGLRYFRLHGSPRKYWSAYEPAALETLATRIRKHPTNNWVIFDNTAQNHAFADAIALKNLL
jgi:uncharacterized protein YecE (DUF72 family)